MVRIVIDKAFSDWFISNMNLSNEVFEDYLDFIKYLNSDLEVFTDLTYDNGQEIHPILLNLINSNNPTISNFNSVSEVCNKKFIKTCPCYTLFFVSINDQEAISITERSGIEIFTTTSFVEKWRFYITGRMRELTIPVGPEGFDSWSKLKLFTHPVRSLIICDPYILSDESKIKTNVIRLLETLLSLCNITGIQKISIVTTDSKQEKSNKYWGQIFDEILQIRNQFKEVEINVFRYPKNVKGHFRAIFTPYWMIYSGNSFNYFDEKGKILDNIKDNIAFHSPFLKSYSKMMSSRLIDVKSYIQKSIDEEKSLSHIEPTKRRYSSVEISGDFLPKLIQDYLA